MQSRKTGIAALILFPDSRRGRDDVAAAIGRDEVAVRDADVGRTLAGHYVHAVVVRGPIHDKAQLVRSWLEKHPQVVTEKFPGYVPDLNPDEGVWGWTKYGRLANLAADDTEELWENVIEELVSAKHNPRVVAGVHPRDWPARYINGRITNVEQYPNWTQ